MSGAGVQQEGAEHHRDRLGLFADSSVLSRTYAARGG